MKDFLIRLGLVFHWTGFVFGIITTLFLLGAAFSDADNAGLFFLVMSPFGFLMMTAIGYLLRWLLTGGDIKFFPHTKS